jgi:hypothetical protein
VGILVIYFVINVSTNQWKFSLLKSGNFGYIFCHKFSTNQWNFSLLKKREFLVINIIIKSSTNQWNFFYNAKSGKNAKYHSPEKQHFPSGLSLYNLWGCFLPCSWSHSVVDTLTTITAARSARLFVQNVWKHHGLPRKVVSDWGPQFVAEFTRELY